MTIMNTHEFNRDTSAAMRAADHGAVVITDRGEPAYVLMSIQEYQRLTEGGTSLVERLSMSDDIDIEFEQVWRNLKPPEL